MISKLVILGVIFYSSCSHVDGLIQLCGPDVGSDLAKNGHFCPGENVTYSSEDCVASLAYASHHCPNNLDPKEAADVLFENCVPDESTSTNCCLAPKRRRQAFALVSKPELKTKDGRNQHVVFRLNYVVYDSEIPTFQVTIGDQVTSSFRPELALEATSCSSAPMMVGTIDLLDDRVEDNSFNTFSIVAVNGAGNPKSIKWNGSFRVASDHLIDNFSSPAVDTKSFFEEEVISQHYATVTSNPNRQPSQAPIGHPNNTPSSIPNETSSPFSTQAPANVRPTRAPTGFNETATAPDLGGRVQVIGEVELIAGVVAAGGLFVASVGFLVRRNRKEKIRKKKTGKLGSRGGAGSTVGELDLAIVDWEIAADNPLRESTAVSTRRNVSSRFLSTLFPQWGDRANLVAGSTRVTASSSLSKNPSNRKNMPLAKPVLGRRVSFDF
jgi:hypothetical protein